MTKKLWLWLAVIVIADSVATWATGRFTSSRNSHDIAKADVAHEKHQAQEKASARIDTVLKTVYVHEKALTAKADQLHAIGDTLGQHAKTVRDSLNMWRGRDSVHIAEAATVRLAKDSADRRAALAIANAARWENDAESTDAINQTLRRDLAQSQDCHVLPFIPCPSRKVVFVVSLAAGAYVATHFEQTKQLITLGRK